MRRMQQLALAAASAAALDSTRYTHRYHRYRCRYRCNRLGAIAAGEALDARALAIVAQPVRGAIKRARAPSAVLARPTGQAEAAVVDTRTVAGAHQTVKTDASHAATEARKAIIAVAFAVDADAVAAAAVGAGLGATVRRCPSGIAHTLLVNACAVLGAARRAERRRAINSAKPLRAVASAVVALAMRWRAPCRARLRRAVGALEAVVALACPASEARAVA